ncbi:hypothetical protein ACJMK2_044669, partial [Sinanodonta woodiana]
MLLQPVLQNGSHTKAIRDVITTRPAEWKSHEGDQICYYNPSCRMEVTRRRSEMLLQPVLQNGSHTKAIRDVITTRPAEFKAVIT